LEVSFGAKRNSAVQRNRSVATKLVIAMISRNRSLTLLVQFGRSQVPETRKQSFNQGRRLSLLKGSCAVAVIGILAVNDSRRQKAGVAISDLPPNRP
jgi:hypothetical protein